MARRFNRMALESEEEGSPLPPSLAVRPYSREYDHEVIRTIYGRSFGEPPWPGDWDQFEPFDPDGVFVAEDVERRETVGYVISFKRRDHGYISVVAVLPDYRRRGIGLALVRTAIGYLRGLGLRAIMVDAPADSLPAVGLYRKAGFGVEGTFEDKDVRPETQ